MKIRNGFVSNSSSSSFTCEICGESYHGWDAYPTDPEYDCAVCENEHIFCNEHRIGDEIEPLEEDNDGYYEYNLHSVNCPICQFETHSEYWLALYLLKEHSVPRTKVFEEVKSRNKRRKKLYDSEYIDYVCKEFDLTCESVLSNIKERFSSWDEFSTYCLR